MTKTKKDNLFITFLQGFVIGFGIIFPISSSVLAMTMGIYERLLKVINNLSGLLLKLLLERNHNSPNIYPVVIACA